MLDIRAIEGILPHRYPFLLVDRVDEIGADKIVARKLVSRNEPHFNGHFPGHPVMPGVLIIEALAQAGGISARGTERRIRINRRNEAGELKVVEPKMYDLVQRDDVVYVRESLF